MFARERTLSEMYIEKDNVPNSEFSLASPCLYLPPLLYSEDVKLDTISFYLCKKITVGSFSATKKSHVSDCLSEYVICVCVYVLVIVPVYIHTQWVSKPIKKIAIT